MNNNSKKKILFIDRDGTLVSEPNDNFQIDAINKIIFQPDVFVSLTKLKKFGYSFIMITNQDGLGTLDFPFDTFMESHNFILKIFQSQNIKFDEVLICPHYITDNCQCRKPKLGLVQPWLNMTEFDKKNSYVIGDRETDIELAMNMDISGIKYGENNLGWLDIASKIIEVDRYAKVYRLTKETEITVQVWLNQEGKSNIQTGINFFNHMLEQISIHGGFSMNILAKGDLHIDDHHTVEDIGIALGEALLQAIGDKKGIGRFGFTLPMDESISSCILDFSNRPYLNFIGSFHYQKIGDFNTDMVEHFFRSLSCSMCSTIHLKVVGKNDHHAIESLFKAFGRAIRQAIKLEGNMLPSSKGIL
ncbi:bifunctional histidinol-phosphatase/imidazoleglycerol-phosphate dehydratase HisB [Buchnera aphidicola]|uniref:bifunctional histidinol-phosphatase/imidazoleglycerol-phosphate dehydratase HisB n=1 Tax=Buchnera aphidicola TaxID=9 RepID=UPI003464E618